MVVIYKKNHWFFKVGLRIPEKKNYLFFLWVRNLHKTNQPTGQPTSRNHIYTRLEAEALRLILLEVELRGMTGLTGMELRPGGRFPKKGKGLGIFQANIPGRNIEDVFYIYDPECSCKFDSYFC